MFVKTGNETDSALCSIALNKSSFSDMEFIFI